jgi:hypothetical protein
VAERADLGRRRRVAPQEAARGADDAERQAGERLDPPATDARELQATGS